MRSRLRIVFLLVIILIITVIFLRKLPHEAISLFPLHNYDQEISNWIRPHSDDYDKPLLTNEQQQTFKKELYRHYFASDNNAMSPWNPAYINQILSKEPPDDLSTVEQEKINQYTNSKDKPASEIGYGVNFRPFTNQWAEELTRNINLSQFKSKQYDPFNRGIAIDNLNARILPIEEAYFYSHKLAGEGYPFDNLQASALWAGTPVYIFGETKDHAWYLILTPDYYIAWVKSTGIARVDNRFISTWQKSAGRNLIAIRRTQISIKDTENNIHRFLGYLGMIFPLENKNKSGYQILIPTMDEKHQAHIHHANLSDQDAILLPLPATPHHFVESIKQLIHRPYGWGNLYFYNDCSAELKNLYALFGIWLPRHSSEQVNTDRVYGSLVDFSKHDVVKRINYLTQNNHKFMTIVYIGGHVFMYLGNYSNPLDAAHLTVPLIYQNVWGLRPKNATPDTDRRAVIGGAVLLPLLKSYPEDQSLSSFAEKKIFKIFYLDEAQQTMAEFQNLEFGKIDLRALLSP